VPRHRGVRSPPADWYFYGFPRTAA